MSKVIRLLAPILVGHDQVPPNAVFDASDEVADMLIEGKDGVPCAELTHTAERYPLHQPLMSVTAFPVFPGDRFPLPKEGDGPEDFAAARGMEAQEMDRPAGETLPGGQERPRLVPGMFRTETDRRIEARIRSLGGAPPGSDVPREVPPARIDQSTVKQDDRPRAEPIFTGPAGPVHVEGNRIVGEPLPGQYGVRPGTPEDVGLYSHSPGSPDDLGPEDFASDDAGETIEAAKNPTAPAPKPPTKPATPTAPAPKPPKSAQQGRTQQGPGDF